MLGEATAQAALEVGPSTPFPRVGLTTKLNGPDCLELLRPKAQGRPSQGSTATPAAFPNVWIPEQLLGYRITLGNKDRRFLAMLG